MDKEFEELTPQQILKHAKKHPHSINISTEAFSVQGKDFVVHNISMKGDPVNDFDVANYRRGLTFIQQIINFKQQSLRVGKKGLRKFYDLLPEYLQSKISHISNSKHFGSIKSKMIEPLKDQAQNYSIYSTQKANGENAQISWDQQGCFWVVGSKNKTLLLAELKDIKYITHKYQHVRTICIAEQWFKFLQANPDKVQNIKQKLSSHVLVGQICDSVKSGHIVDYGEQIKLYFYTLVAKQQRQFSCQPPSKFLQFVKKAGLDKYCVQFKITSVKSFQALMQQLKKQMYRVYEGEIQKLGEGSVLYITTTKNGEEHCQSICKVKTLQYRIYRKLREKLKAYFQKFRKSYEKMLNKFIQEVKQLTKGFQTPKPQQYYFHVAKRAFQFCQDQQKAVSKFFHNKFIGFLKLIQNQKINKQDFKKIMHQQMDNTQIKKMLQQKRQQITQTKQKIQQQNLKKGQQQNNKEKIIKKVCVFVGMTIPASGKSTLYKKIMENNKDFHFDLLSSDTVRAQKMAQLMKKQKNMNKKTAYEKTKDSANNQYYRYLNDIMKNIQNCQQKFQNYILFLDKNHPENALKKTVEQIRRAAQKCPSLIVKIIGVLPKCDKLLIQKSKYSYPFSASYVLSCIKRLTSREQHQTLEGTVQHRVNVCLGFSNMFRNFSISNYNLSKYFDGVIRFPFTKQQQVSEQLSSNLLKVILGTKPGSFDEHPALDKLIEDIKNWKSQQINFNQVQQQIAQTLNELFQNFQNIKVDVSKFGIFENVKKQ